MGEGGGAGGRQGRGSTWTARRDRRARARTRRDVRRDAVLRGARAAHARRLAKTTRDGPMGTAARPTRVVGGERTSGRLVTSRGRLRLHGRVRADGGEDRGCEAIEAPRPDPRHRRRGGRRRPRRCPHLSYAKSSSESSSASTSSYSFSDSSPSSGIVPRARARRKRARSGGRSARAVVPREGERRESEALVTRGASQPTGQTVVSDRNRGRDGSTLRAVWSGLARVNTTAPRGRSPPSPSCPLPSDAPAPARSLSRPSFVHSGAGELVHLRPLPAARLDGDELRRALTPLIRAPEVLPRVSVALARQTVIRAVAQGEDLVRGPRDVRERATRQDDERDRKDARDAHGGLEATEDGGVLMRETRSGVGVPSFAAKDGELRAGKGFRVALIEARGALAATAARAHDGRVSGPARRRSRHGPDAPPPHRALELPPLAPPLFRSLPARSRRRSMSRPSVAASSSAEGDDGAPELPDYDVVQLGPLETSAVALGARGWLGGSDDANAYVAAIDRGSSSSPRTPRANSPC